MKIRLALAAALAAVALTACAPSGGPTVTETETETVMVIASPDAEPTWVPADCPEWVDDADGFAEAPIDFNRFAGICLGMSFDEASDVAGIAIQADESCPWLAPIVSDDEVGLHVWAVSAIDKPGEEIEMFFLNWYKDPIEAWAYEVPYTEEGVRVGTPQADVAEFYPDSYTVNFEDEIAGPREQQVIAGPDGLAIASDIVDGYVSAMYWGKGLTHGGPNGYACE